MSSQSTLTSGLAGRYATAIFELAEEAHAIDGVHDDLVGLQAMIDESDDLRRVLRSPLIPRDQAGKAMDALLDAAGVSDLTRRFVGLAAKNRRLFALENMISAFRTLRARHRGEVTAEVTSATPLSDAQQAAVLDALKRVMGSAVAVDHKVDPDLIGGLVVRVGSRMVDSSLRTKLQKLQIAMKGAA
ncbi:MAG: F0F1 ATP synthase subunit delta [Alphaproteobacteria bacterium]|nr:F0F1 ATP synthase subunit delta [Alphaproteobacteria bacterium]